MKNSPGLWPNGVLDHILFLRHIVLTIKLSHVRGRPRSPRSLQSTTCPTPNRSEVAPGHPSARFFSFLGRPEVDQKLRRTPPGCAWRPPQTSKPISASAAPGGSLVLPYPPPATRGGKKSGESGEIRRRSFFDRPNSDLF